MYLPYFKIEINVTLAYNFYTFWTTGPNMRLWRGLIGFKNEVTQMY